MQCQFDVVMNFIPESQRCHFVVRTLDYLLFPSLPLIFSNIFIRAHVLKNLLVVRKDLDSRLFYMLQNLYLLLPDTQLQICTGIFFSY